MVKKIRKGLAIILVASMIMSMLQLTTFAAGELGDGTPGNPYQIGATVKGGETEPAGEKVEHSKWVGTPVDVTYEEEASCEKAEHIAHDTECYSQICEFDYEHTHTALGEVDGCQELTCEAVEHSHSDDCYSIICGKTEHSHDAECCDKTEHTHGRDCDYICGKWEHSHGLFCGLGCMVGYEHSHSAECCGKTEHTHGTDCDTEKCGGAEEHSHSAECKSLVCELSEYAHRAACYEVCEIVEHGHSALEAENGCYQLTCEIELHEHSIEDGCFAVAEEAHTLWTLVEQTYSATVTVKRGNDSVSGAFVTLKDSDGDIVAQGTTAKNGGSRYASFSELKAGTYDVVITYDDNYTGTGTLEVTEGTNAATITLSKVNTASHLDIHIGLTAKYTDTATGKTYETEVVLTKQDYLQGRLQITADSEMRIDADKESDISADPSYPNQMRFFGFFPVGTYADPVEYAIKLTKDVTFTLENDETLSIPMTFERTGIHYWHEGNLCESIHSYGYTNSWAKGNFVEGGMDFKLGASEASGSSEAPKATLTIQKNVAVNGEASTADMTFDFSVYGADGTKIDDVEVAIPANQSVAIGTIALPINADYYVVENDPAAVEKHTLTTTVSVAGAAATTGTQSDSFTMADDTSVVFTNTYSKNYEPTHSLGSITVTKSTSGAETPATATFQLEKNNGEQWEGFGSPVNYSAFSGGSYTFRNLEEGTYRVVEANADLADYDLAVTNSETATLTKNDVGDKGDTAVSSGSISIGNAYSFNKGSLKITKTSNHMELVPAGTSFTVTGPNGYSKTVSYSEFTDDSYTIGGLSLGEYTVTENVASAQVTGYHLAAPEAQSAEVAKNETATVTITNTYTLLPATSVSGKITVSFDKAVIGDAYTMNGNDFAFSLSDGTNAYTGYNAADGSVDIEVPFDVDLAGESGNSVDKTFAFTLSETAGSVEGMNYDSTEYAISVVIRFTREGALSAWTWSIASVDSQLVETIENSIISLSAEDGAVFTNEYDKPVYTGSITLIKEIKGELNQEEKSALADKLDFVVNKVFAIGGGNAYIQYTSMTDGKWVMATEQPGTYTITENDAEVDGYKLTTEWKVEGATNDSSASAQFELAAGDEVTVTVTNTYKKIPTYKYKVVHEYFYSENGGEYQSVGTNAGTIHTVAEGENTPTHKAVFDAQAVNESYGDYSYSRLSKYEDGEVEREGVLRENTLVFTVKYYRSDWTEGSLVIRKNFNGLDETTLASMKNVLTFTVTSEDGFEEVISYKDFDKNGTYTLTDLVPGTYTVVENGAELEGSGYELSVTASDADDELAGYQVKVSAGESAARFTITNSYSSRIYNIWFGGGAHGSVQLAGLNEEGLLRNRWQLFQVSKDETYYDWGNLLLAPGKLAYQTADGSANIYEDLIDNPEIAKGTAQVLYTFSWSQWADNQKTMGIEKPFLKVDAGYTSDKEYYIPGTDTKFESIEEAMAYMNSGTVEPDANGFYNVLYVARYEKELPKKEFGSISLSKSFTVNQAAVSAPEGFDGSFQLQKLEGGVWTTVQTIAWSEFVGGNYEIGTVETGTYRVVEVDGEVSGYNWTYKATYADDSGESNDSVIVDANEIVEVAVENTYREIPVVVPDNPGPGGGDDGDDDDDDDESFEIIDEDPPLSDIPDEEPPLADIPEEDVPLADVPKTGDSLMLWLTTALSSGVGLAYLSIPRKRKEEEV